MRKYIKNRGTLSSTAFGMRSLNLNWIVEATDQSQAAGNGFGNRSAATHPLGRVLGVSIPITHYPLPIPITHYPLPITNPSERASLHAQAA
jgi:hypothetical protein